MRNTCAGYAFVWFRSCGRGNPDFDEGRSGGRSVEGSTAPVCAYYLGDMTNLMLPLVTPDEAGPYYKAFLEAFPDGCVGDHLQAQTSELERLCAGLSESGALFRYAEGKWTVKEVIGHLLDSERVFAYRLLRISRGDATALPGFDETTYVPVGEFNLRDVAGFGVGVHAPAGEYARTRERYAFGGMGSRRDGEWRPYERSGTCLRHSGAHRSPFRSPARTVSATCDRLLADLDSPNVDS